MLTRMLHMTMIFDVKSWAKWAMNSGVDPRGIAFVLTYPEVITGERTTPRTLTQFLIRSLVLMTSRMNWNWLMLARSAQMILLRLLS